jgi:outer membrane protein assembly factor BamE
VRFILGTPLLEDPFDQSRWDYPYVKRNGQKVLSESKLTVYFDGDSLMRFDTDLEDEDLPQELDSEQPEG